MYMSSPAPPPLLLCSLLAVETHNPRDCDIFSATTTSSVDIPQVCLCKCHVVVQIALLNFSQIESRALPRCSSSAPPLLLTLPRAHSTHPPPTLHPPSTHPPPTLSGRGTTTKPEKKFGYFFLRSESIRSVSVRPR
jgi:hypothetical protein